MRHRFYNHSYQRSNRRTLCTRLACPVVVDRRYTPDCRFGGQRVSISVRRPAGPIAGISEVHYRISCPALMTKSATLRRIWAKLRHRRQSVACSS